MQIIQSKLTGERGSFGEVRDALAPEGFTLANWDYDKGYLDKQLDDKAMVFLRIPIEVRQGALDDVNTLIQFGTPFVLKHVYQTGIDEDIGAMNYMSTLLNQFQEPIDKDASLSPESIQKAEEVLKKIEGIFV